jgi:hypothetical protein
MGRHIITLDRRDFIKGALVGGAGLVLANAGISPALAAGAADPTRVAFIKDAAMCPSGLNYNAAVMRANVDKMAVAMTQASSAAEAWRAIFPTASSSSKVAIKVVAWLGETAYAPPVLGKICEELVLLGVKASNIYLYDMGGVGGVPLDGLPSGVTRHSQGAGSSYHPAFTGADIVLSYGLNRAHPMGEFDNYTLSAKNHLGSFGVNQNNHSRKLIVDILKQAGSRHALAIVDSLYTSAFNPGTFETKRDTLAMGVHPAAVDYLTVKNVPGRTCGAFSKALIGDFGWSDATLKWIDAATVSNPGGTGLAPQAPTNVRAVEL